MEIHEHPSFVKVFHGGLAKELKIPDPFVSQHSQIIPKKLALMTRKGNPVVVSVERRSKGQCFFTLGWTHFVEENNLEEGDIIFFYFHGDRTLNVVVYDLLGCLKGVKLTGHRSAEPRTVAKRVKRAATAANEKLFEFKTFFKSYQKYYQYMPLEFAETVGLKAGGNALFKDPKGKIWIIGVTDGDTTGRQKRFGSSWNEFVRKNGIEDGDKLSFSFKPSLGFIEVKISKGVILID